MKPTSSPTLPTKSVSPLSRSPPLHHSSLITHHSSFIIHHSSFSFSFCFSRFHSRSLLVFLFQTEKLMRLMKDPRRGLDIKTRTYRLRKHKDCFVGLFHLSLPLNLPVSPLLTSSHLLLTASEATAWFMQNLGLSTVEEALAIGECLVHRFVSSSRSFAS